MNDRSLRDLIALSLLSCLMFGAKFALQNIPNVHLGAVLLIVATLRFGYKALYMVFVYIMLEGLVFGFSVWWFSYLFVWPVLVFVAMLFRKNESPVLWAVIAGAYGLCFGPLMYLEYFAINGGWEMFFAMWVAGIPYDLTHCISNFVVTLVLYKPLHTVMARLLQQSGQ